MIHKRYVITNQGNIFLPVPETSWRHSGNDTEYRSSLAGSEKILHLFSLLKASGTQEVDMEALRYRKLPRKHGHIPYLRRGEEPSRKLIKTEGKADCSLQAAFVSWVWHTALYFV